MKTTCHKFFIFCVGLLFVQSLSAQVFKVQTREFSPYLVQNNATFNQTPLTGTKVQKDFDIINLTALNQDIIVRKIEILLNVVSNIDKALASYCFGVNCHGAEVFADTVTFLPNQSVALEIDFIEASAPGNSLIRYQVINKNNLSEQLNIYMNYAGVLAIQNYESNKRSFLLYPNPAKGALFLLNTGELKNEALQLQIKDVMGKVLVNQAANFSASDLLNLHIANLPAGLYSLELKASENTIFTQKLIID